MANNETPQTPRTPTPPPAPTSSNTATVTTIVQRNVTNAGGASAVAPVGDALSGSSVASISEMIGPDTKFQIPIGVSTITIDGETIIYDRLRNSNYQLNSTGSFIWSSVSPGLSFSDLLAKVRSEHEVVPEDYERMVAQFLASLIDKGVLAASPLASRS